MAANPSRRHRGDAVPNYVPGRRSGGPHPTVTPDMILERVLDFLKRRGIVAGTVALLVGVGVSLAAWWLLPLTFTARRDINLSPPDGNRLAEFKQTYIEKLISPAVCKIAVNLPQARELGFVQASADPAEVLSKWIEVDSDPLAQSFSVMISDADPKVAQTLVNCVVEGFLQYAQDEKSRQIADDVKVAEVERDENLRSIQRIKDQQVELARQAGYGDPDSLRKQMEETQDQKREVEKEIDRTEFQRIEAQKELEVAMSSGDELTPEQLLAIQSAAGGRQDLNRALAQLEAQADQIAQNSIHGTSDPDYIRYKTFIDDQRKSAGGGQDELRARYQQANRMRREADVRRIEGRIAGIEQQGRVLRQRLSQLASQTVRLQDVAQEIAKSRLALESHERTVQSANNRLSFLRTSAKETDVKSPIEADLPKIPKSSSKRLLAIFGGGLAAFLGVLSLFAFADLKVNIITRPEHLEKTQPLPVLGVLPRLPEGKRLPGDEDYAPGAKYRSNWLSMNEAINSLRITLTFAPDRHNDGMSTLMITSPRDAEGKSTFAAQLAISLARTGVKVLLVEADFHRPTQYETFGVKREPGLSDVLQQKVPLAEAIRETEYPDLSILPAGSPIDARKPTLMPDRVQQLFAELRGMFQTIIVDAPPVLPVYDALVFGQHVDQTVLMVRCDHSRFHTIDQSRSRLESVGIQVAGLVVAGTGAATRYGYYYDSYATASGKSNGSSKGRNSSNPGNIAAM